MKGLFPQYEILDDVSKNEAWQEAAVVLDTNVLLNLYRYQKPTRDQLIEILKGLSDRLWIPYQVALEFQRNRLGVIAEQVKKFSEIKALVDSNTKQLVSGIENLGLNKRHALINVETFLFQVAKNSNEFLDQLDKLKLSEQQDISRNDPLKEIIETIYQERVGPAPANQNELDELCKQAQKRYDLGIPPGFADKKKENKDFPKFSHNGLVYDSKFGDFLVWSQILAYAQSRKFKSVILVTDDNKEDWWLKVDSEGPKIIGPRPELIEEIRRVAGVESFLLYRSEGFMIQAKKYLKAAVTDDAIQDVREKATEQLIEVSTERKSFEFSMAIQDAVEDWLVEKFGGASRIEQGYPDYRVYDNDGYNAYEMKYLPASSVQRRSQILLLARELRKLRLLKLKGEYRTCALILVSRSNQFGTLIRNMLVRNLREMQEPNISVIFGYLDKADDNTEFRFIETDEIDCNSSLNQEI